MTEVELSNFKEEIRVITGIYFTEGDDFDVYVVSPMVKVFDYMLNKVSKNNIHKLDSTYANFTVDELKEIGTKLFFINFTGTETLEEVYSMIKQQMSLDNLTKTGIRQYYLSKGYSDVEVIYDQDNRKIDIYGELSLDYLDKEIEADVNNGVATIPLDDNEVLASVDEVKLVDIAGREITIFSKAQIETAIKNQIGTVDLPVVKDVVQKAVNSAIEIDGDKIILKSAALGSDSYLSEDVISAYKTVIKSNLANKLKDLETIGHITFACIKSYNEKVAELNVLKGELSTNYSSVSSKLKNAITEIYNKVNSGVAAYNLKAQSVNENIGKYITEIETINSEITKMANAIESIPTKTELEVFVNNLNKLNSKLEFLLSTGG